MEYDRMAELKKGGIWCGRCLGCTDDRGRPGVLLVLLFCVQAV